MKLHYSQTLFACSGLAITLNYHMKLHYSQTWQAASQAKHSLNYHMKLHYSQTFLGIWFDAPIA